MAREEAASASTQGAGAALLGLADIDGVLRGKFVSAEKLASLRAKDGGFCDCVFGWDMDDALYDSGDEAATGWHTGFPDARYRLIAATARNLSGDGPEAGTPYFIGEFAARDGGDHPLCPRTLLRRVLARAAASGLSVRAGFEYEFFVFKETPASARAKHYRNLAPFTPGNFGYSVLRAAANADVFKAFMEYCAALRMPLEGLHCETGPGVWEGALAPAEGMESADRAALFKTLSKAFFQRRELMATFMAKWSMDYPGQSGHYHFSLEDQHGRNVFAGDGEALTDAAGWALGGLCRYAPEFLPMLAPTVNSYTRLVKGAWAPTAATWGMDNRTAAFRFVPGRGADATARRVEGRVGGADGNPYLVAAATLGAALLGIERRLAPPAAVRGNAYDIDATLPQERRFAPTLREAAECFGASEAARELFGEPFTSHFAASRLWESREHERQVTNWQLGRYFEIV